MDFDVLKILKDVGMFMVPFLFSLSLHEYAHGWVAKRKGDPTAERMGRLSMNPMVHADIIGTFVFPILAVVSGSHLFFGWANPVPVDERNFKNRKTDMFWVAAAGPGINLILAFISIFLAVALSETGLMGKFANEMIQAMIGMNLALAIFNLLPVHPLDGGKILARFLPPDLERKMEDNQQMIGIILMVLLFTGIIGQVLRPAIYAVDGVMYFVANTIVGIAI